MITCFRRSWWLVVCGLLLAPDGAVAQDPKSAALAKELSEFMTRASLDSIAAKDAAEPDRFVAALFFAGRQLLVVGARYSAPQLLDQKIQSKQYRDVYIDLNSASVPDSKSFIDDLGADGLRARPQENQPFDSFEMGTKRQVFDGDWRRQKQSEADYMKAYTEAEEAYAKMLAVLLAQIKKAS